MRPHTRSKVASYLFYIPFALPIWKFFKGAGVKVADMRRNYQLAGLTETDLDPDPFKQFEKLEFLLSRPLLTEKARRSGSRH